MKSPNQGRKKNASSQTKKWKLRNIARVVCGHMQEEEKKRVAREESKHDMVRRVEPVQEVFGLLRGAVWDRNRW